MVTVTDTAPIAGQNDEREQKSMNRETYETYSAACLLYTSDAADD